MITFICIFFPAVISLWFFETLVKKKFCLREIIYRFCFNTVIINLCCFLVKKHILHTAGSLLCQFPNDMTPQTAANYLIIAIPTVIILAAAEAFIAKNLEIYIDDDTQEKNKY